MYRFFPFWLAAGLLTATALPANAQNVSFTLVPLNHEATVQPGTQHTGVITLRSEAGPGSAAKTVRLRIYPMDWTLDREGAPQFSKPGSTHGSCSTWAQVNPTEVTLTPGETQEVRYTLNIPENARGAYRTIFMFETAAVASQNETGQAVAVRGRVGSVLYVQVGPQAKRARLTAFQVTPEKAQATVVNTGTSHLRLKGMLQFRDSEGKVVQKVPLPGAVILPGEGGVRDLVLETPKLPRPGTYGVTVILDYGGEVLLGGRASVTIP